MTASGSRLIIGAGIERQDLARNRPRNVLADRHRYIPQRGEVAESLEGLQQDEEAAFRGGSSSRAVGERDFLGRRGKDVREILWADGRFQAGIGRLVDTGHGPPLSPAPASGNARYLKWPIFRRIVAIPN